MILELKIQNFLSFRNEVIFSFEATSDTTLDDYYVVKQDDGTRILKMAMVYGANASGKSNLIKAFEFLIDFVYKKPDERQSDTPFVPFMFDSSRNEPGHFELLFYAKGKKYKYQLVIDTNIVYEERLFFYPGTQPAIIFSREYDADSNVSVVNFGAKIKISEQAREAIQLQTLNDTSVFSARNLVNVSIPELDTVNNWFKEQYLNSINPYHSLTEFSDKEIQNNPKIKENALRFLKEADFNITDIVFKNGIKYFEQCFILNGITEKHLLNETSVSKGTLRYYGLSVPFLFAIKKNAFLPIDDIDVSLHEHLIIHLIKSFLQKSNTVQLIFTTNLTTILNERDILRKDTVWFTEMKETGSTDLYSLSDFNFRKELSFFKAYNIGKFGGVPELS